MISPGTRFALAFSDALAPRVASSAEVYFLVATLFVLLWSLVLAVRLFWIFMTAETGKPHDPDDPFELYDRRR